MMHVRNGGHEDPMSCYRWIWRGLWGTVAALVIAAALLNWSPEVVLGMFLIPGGAAGLATFLYYRDPARPLATPSEALRRAGLVGAGTGGCAVAFASLMSTLPTLVLPLIVLCLCTSPVVLRRVRNAVLSASDARRRRGAAAAAEPVWWSMLAREVEGLGDGELCRVWRGSYLALLQAADAESAAQVVRVRQVYLAELDRRHPQAVKAWMASGPHPAAGPERFLQEQRGRDAA
jgi:hypothetical protein